MKWDLLGVGVDPILEGYVWVWMHENSTANNRESTRIAFFQFRPLDLRSRHYASPHRLRVAVTAERKMLENPRRGFSLKILKSL